MADELRSHFAHYVKTSDDSRIAPEQEIITYATVSSYNIFSWGPCSQIGGVVGLRRLSEKAVARSGKQ